ncbi:pgl [Symbiodinium natans]|uniref:Pgl protein n=1 Tax=Symbiodinium natans TaxID=878477 RepID=A0A812U1R1_9DINO|nr:pgl [Symbiodinium natans]
MCQPSPTIAGFLQQAEDNLALLRARAQFTPRKARERRAEESPESASARMSQRLKGTASTHASPLQEEPVEELSRTPWQLWLRELDRKVRGFDARFRSMEKAVASAADLAAASSRCGRDGIEAATAATAAVRVEAEAKCRELAQRIESLSGSGGRWTQELEARIDNCVQASLTSDLRCLERRLVAQFSQRHSEVLEAAQQMMAELKAEVSLELEALQGRSCRRRPAGRGSEGALEGRLSLAEKDLRRALRDVDDLERVAAGPLRHLEQRVASLEAREEPEAMAPGSGQQEKRIDRLEADLVKLFRKLGTTVSVGVQDPRARQGVPEVVLSAAPDTRSSEQKAAKCAEPPRPERTLQPSELAGGRELQEIASKASGAKKADPATELLEAVSDSAGTPSAPPSPSSPLPSRPVVPFQPPSRRPSRPLLTVPGGRRASGIETKADSEPEHREHREHREASAGASRDLWDNLLARTISPRGQAHLLEFTGPLAKADDVASRLQHIPSLLQLCSPEFPVLACVRCRIWLVYVGSAGCDYDDSSCHDSGHTANTVFAYDVLRGGTIVPNPPLHVDVGGLPLWLTIKESAELNYKCMFATLADNQISVLQDPGSSLTAFEPIQTLPSGGLTPVFASLSLDQKFLLVANYNGNDDPAGAGVSVFRIESDCKLSRSDFAKHQGSSVDSSRQLAAHTHGVVVSSRRNIIYAFDLGMDVVFSYKLSDTGELEELHRTAVFPASGPRHGVEHPSLPILYVICEMGKSVLVFQELDDGRLALRQLNQLHTHEPDELAKAAEIAMSASGKTLYATNRGEKDSSNTVTVFSILQNGHLKVIQQIKAPKYPRGMTLAHDDRILLVAGQSNSDLTVYTVQPEGKLSEQYTLSKGLPPQPAAIAVLQEPVGEL